MKKVSGIFLAYMIFFSMFAPMVEAQPAQAPEISFAEADSPLQPSPITLPVSDSPGTGSATDAAAGNNPSDAVPPPSAPAEGPATTPDSGAGNAPVQQVNEFMCSTSELSPQESQNIIDLLKTGFTGNEIAGQTSKDTDRDKLASNELVLINPEDENSAVKTEIPDAKFKANEISQFLNTSIDGPFAFGVVLEDSLRTGRCAEFDSPDCTLTGPNLKYRNSGSGILADVKPVKEAFSEGLDSFLDGNKNLSQFTKEENDALRAQLLIDDLNESQIKTAKRLETDLIPNSILTNFFEARLQTNCNNSACVISTYSLFDKYFNSWMSTEMVVSTFGPSLLYQTKKLFGWNARRGFLSGVREGYYEFLDRFRKQFVTPDSFLGKIRKARIQSKVDKYGWRDYWQSMVDGSSDGSGYALSKTTEFQDWWGKMGAKGGWLEQIKTADERSAFISMLKDMRSVNRAAQARTVEVEQAWTLAKETLGPDNPVTRQKYIEFGQEVGRWSDEVIDGVFGLDHPEWIVRHPNLGLYNKGVLQIREDGTSEVVDLFTEHRNFQRILSKFHKSGTFRNFENERELFQSVYQTRGDDLVLYVFDQTTAQNYRGLSYSNLERAATNRRNTFALTDYGEQIIYNKASFPMIQSRIGGNAQLFEGSWREAGVLTPESMVDRLTNARTFSNMKVSNDNIQQMLDTVQEKNWVSRRYWNSLDKLIAQEDELVRSYFTIKGGVKWTTLPFGYWWAKKGFGVEGISQYQLPDTWHDLKFTIGTESVYNYSYIDFFANEGSDQGDLFIQMINKLPWKIVLDELSDKYNPVKNLYDALTKNELRSETENLAYYLTGPDECVGCSVTIKSGNGLNEFRPFFLVQNQKLVSYILEDTVTDKAKEKGQTLIAFAGHTNLEGQSGRDKGNPIDLVEALKADAEKDPEVKTCRRAVEELEFYGFEFGKVLPEFTKEEGRIGAVLGGLEAITYGTFFWAGIFSTAAIQIAIAPQLHGCVDVDEGYYAHYFVPVKETKDTQTGTTEKSTEKVSELVQKFKEPFIDSFKGDENTLTKEAVEDIGDEIDKFVNDSKENNIVQATLRMEGLSSGQLDSKELFYFWCGTGCKITPATYRTEGSEEVRGVNDVNVGIDFAKGVITQNGVPIVQAPDNVRMATTNLGIPAIEIPRTLTESCIENSTDVAIEINAKGEVRVLNSELLDCIKNGVMEQTGRPLESEKLNDVFGKLNSIVTTTHPNITPLGDKIIAEGVPRKIAEGDNAKIFILANKDVNLSSSNDGETSVGQLQSLQFENGTIVVKPNGCFLAWLAHHPDGVLSKELVEGLKPKLEREFNEETQCQEPAINLELIPDFGSDFKVAKVENFNEALAHQGPFTVFETPTKRYIISSEKEENGECRDHLRVVDKETGEVTDYTGTISQTPEGFKITTDDGQTHDVKFSTKDGAPFVQFDNDKPELLTSAQGKNGSFYYDPDKGLWFAENAQLLPLIEAFREGIAAKVGPGGEATATASGNVLNLDLGKDEGGFLNLASLPEQQMLLVLMLAALVAVFVGIRVERERKRKKPAKA